MDLEYAAGQLLVNADDVLDRRGVPFGQRPVHQDAPREVGVRYFRKGWQVSAAVEADQQHAVPEFGHRQGIGKTAFDAFGGLADVAGAVSTDEVAVGLEGSDQNGFDTEGLYVAQAPAEDFDGRRIAGRIANLTDQFEFGMRFRAGRVAHFTRCVMEAPPAGSLPDVDESARIGGRLSRVDEGVNVATQLLQNLCTKIIHTSQSEF